MPPMAKTKRKMVVSRRKGRELDAVKAMLKSTRRKERQLRAMEKTRRRRTQRRA